MVWVPTKGQRSGIQSRFAELTKNFQHVVVSRVAEAHSAEPFIERQIEDAASRAGVSDGAFSGEAAKNSTPPSSKRGVNKPAKTVENKPQSKNSVPEWSVHHIPPKNPKQYLLKRVRHAQHQAYHTIFGSAGSFEECVQILKRDWWPETLSPERDRQ